jgi:hypothetical protein
VVLNSFSKQLNLALKQDAEALLTFIFGRLGTEEVVAAVTLQNYIQKAVV